MKTMTVWQVCAAACIAGACARAQQGAEIGFVEEFALSTNREAAIRQLVPGTDDYYFYTCLQLQNTGQLAKVDPLVTQWVKTHGETAHANNESLHRVYELAAELDLPVFVHSNASSVWKRDPIYLHEFEEAVQQNPKTKFVWCHAGISRRVDIPTLTQEIDRMLATYPNMSVDISWVLFDTYLVKDGKPVPAWLALFEKFPTRFIIGSDKVGRFHDYAPVMQRYYVLLDAMKPETAKRIAHDNMLAILPKQGAVLKPETAPAEVRQAVPVPTR